MRKASKVTSLWGSARIGRLLLLASILAVMVSGSRAQPDEGRCSGTGSGSGEQAALSCNGTCASCPTVKHLPNGNAVCSCVDNQAPACCHVELADPGMAGAHFVSAGDCPSCNTVGACGLVVVNGQTQPTCSLPH